MAYLQKQPFTGLQLNVGSTRPCRTRSVTPLASSNGVSNGWKTTDIYGNTAVLGPTANTDKSYSMPEGPVEAPSAEVKAILEEQGIDLEISGLKYMNNEGRVRLAIDHKHNWNVLYFALSKKQ